MLSVRYATKALLSALVGVQAVVGPVDFAPAAVTGELSALAEVVGVALGGTRGGAASGAHPESVRAASWARTPRGLGWHAREDTLAVYGTKNTT
jgi:hypothetical protein